jgi:hypothetical protein
VGFGTAGLYLRQRPSLGFLSGAILVEREGGLMPSVGPELVGERYLVSGKFRRVRTKAEWELIRRGYHEQPTALTQNRAVFMRGRTVDMICLFMPDSALLGRADALPGEEDRWTGVEILREATASERAMTWLKRHNPFR